MQLTISNYGRMFNEIVIIQHKNDSLQIQVHYAAFNVNHRIKFTYAVCMCVCVYENNKLYCFLPL